MKAPTPAIRFSEAQKLLDYGFSNYEATSFGKKGDIINTINVNKGTSATVNAILEEDAQVLTKKSNSSEISQEINLSDNINAPILKGQKLGEITYKINGNTVSCVNLVADKDVSALTFGSINKKVFKSWFSLFRNS